MTFITPAGQLVEVYPLSSSHNDAKGRFAIGARRPDGRHEPVRGETLQTRFTRIVAELDLIRLAKLRSWGRVVL